MKEYLSSAKGKSSDALFEFVGTNGGNYYMPMMINIKGDWVVLVYKCSMFGHVDFTECTYEEHFDDEYKARHCMMACRYYMNENGTPNHELHDKPSVDEYAELEEMCMNYENGLTPMDI